jgi:hypothetical protein
MAPHLLALARKFAAESEGKMRYFLSDPGIIGGNSKGNPGYRWEFWKDWARGPAGRFTPMISEGPGGLATLGSSKDKSFTTPPHWENPRSAHRIRMCIVKGEGALGLQG